MIITYLNFKGECEAAFRLYQRAFDSAEPVLARYGDAPDSAYPGMDEAWRTKIMHGQINLTKAGGVSGMPKDKFGFNWVLSAYSEQ